MLWEMSNMKKYFKICTIVISMFLLTGCIYSKSDLEEAYQNGYNEGYEIGLQEGYDTGYDEGSDTGFLSGKAYQNSALRSMGILPERPETGDVLSGKASGKSEISVTASDDCDYVVVVKDTKGKEKVAFYVRAGETATIKVPAMYLDVYFACGTDWLGYKKGLMFGEETCYSKDDQTMNFKEYTWEYTMTPVTNGNFSETPSNAEEFF